MVIILTITGLKLKITWMKLFNFNLILLDHVLYDLSGRYYKLCTVMMLLQFE